MTPSPLRLFAVLSLLAPAVLAAPDDHFDGRAKEKVRAEAPQVPAIKPKLVQGDGRLWVVAAAASREERTALANLGLSIEEVQPGRVGAIGTPDMVKALEARGVRYTAVSLAERFSTLDFPSEDSIYHNYKEMEAELKAIASAGQGLASLFPIGRSTLGKTLWCLRLNTSASGTEPSPKPGIVFMGTHHAREHLSTEVPLLLAKHLVDNRGKPEIAKLLAERDIYVIPMVNPDGVEYDIRDDRYHMHRKNLRKNDGGSVGVDLNRNYGFHWGEGGASDNPDSDIYKGPSPFSEPESRAIRDFVTERRRSSKLNVLLSYHTFSELILYPWGHSYDPIPDGRALAAYKAMAGKMAQMTGYTPEQSSDLYIASGDTTDWSWGELGVFSFTFELTPKSMWGGGFYPGAGAVAGTLANNIAPALYLIGLADDPYRAGQAETAAAGAFAPAGGK